MGYSLWGRKVPDTTEQLINNSAFFIVFLSILCPKITLDLSIISSPGDFSRLFNNSLLYEVIKASYLTVNLVDYNDFIFNSFNAEDFCIMKKVHTLFKV